MALIRKNLTPMNHKKSAAIGISVAVVVILLVSFIVASRDNGEVTENINTNTAITTTPADDIQPTFIHPVTGEALPSLPNAISTIDANPESYDDKEICLEGFYQGSFEFSAIGPDFRIADNGDRIINKPWVWVTGASLDDEPGVDCTLTEFGQQTCFGEVAVCGTLHYAPEGEEGFGHVNAYQYEISIK
ncbi:MAG: hypothetical protein WCV86_02055 [Patescibacteria group bacterium]|jgi:hypothetical protein